MDFEEFSSKVGSPKLKPLVFHAVDSFVVVGYHHRRKYSVFALAWHDTADYPGEGYTYALAISPSAGGYELAVLRKFGDPTYDDPWDNSRSNFFKSWVQEWIKSHPSQLVNGAIKASRVNWDSLYECRSLNRK